LAVTRARAHGGLIRLLRLSEDIARQMDETVGVMASCDKLIRLFDNSLDPELIPPIKSWKGHYGQRGQLSASVGVDAKLFTGKRGYSLIGACLSPDRYLE
jgi:hypothetical protein